MKRFNRPILCYLTWLAGLSLAAAELPLHVEIDRIVEAGCAAGGLQIAPLADDAEFLRRVYLDLAGVIPPADVTRAFLDDKNRDKRRQMIDALLASPEYALQMSRVFHVMLTERRIATIKSYDVPPDEWREYLIASFSQNKPWDQLVRELLTSDGSDTEIGAAAKFFLVRDTDAHLLTRDIGRLLLGIDLQCAQCHDDPRYGDYLQADYYGLYAFLNRLQHFRDQAGKRSFVVEKATGDVHFTSVFTALQATTNPRLPGGRMIEEPRFDKGQEYEVAPAKGVRPVPRYSRRLQLALQLPRAETAGFTRNIVNRLWAHMMGRGLIHPVDLSHSRNPASHPVLLTLLQQTFEELEFDIKRLLRELALSRTYQRSSRIEAAAFADRPAPASFAVAALRALTPEQLGWSVLQATGRVATRLSEKAPQAERHSNWKTEVYRHLEREVEPFVRVFAGLPGQPDGDFEPSVDQSLFLLNDEVMLSLLSDRPRMLVDRLDQHESAVELADELFLHVLSRRPDRDELHGVAQILENASDGQQRKELIRQLVWGQLLSAEFRLNH